MSPERSDAMRAFLRGAGWADASLSPLPGDASTRRYIRLRRNRLSAMLMDQPPNAETPQCPDDATPEQRQALGYNAAARLAGADCGRFVAAANFLRKQGLSAPDVYAADIANGFVLIEDFGDDLYANVLTGGDGSAERTLYAAAIDALATLHSEHAPRELAGRKPLHSYDETALLAETGLMTEWLVPLALKRTVSPDERQEHDALWRDTLRPVLTAARVFVHRDYHTQNLFWVPQREGTARVGLIDFQDAVAGAASYDVVSLLEDARRDVPASLAEEMFGRYLDAMVRRDGGFDREAYLAQAAIMAAQRNAKIAGIFARLFTRDGKPRYLSYLPRVWGYLERDLAHPALAELKSWYDRKIPPDARYRVLGEAA